MVEELLEHVQPVGPADGVRMQHHREMPAALVLRVELGLPVAEQRVGILQARALAREQQEELVVEVIVVGQGRGSRGGWRSRSPSSAARRRPGRCRNSRSRLEQQIDRVRADAPPANLSPAAPARTSRPALARDLRDDLGGALEPRALLVFGQHADILIA
jgi:hypothetical protein